MMHRSNTEHKGRLSVATRWWIDDSAQLHDSWPEPGFESSGLAVGWVAADRPIGVIEFPSDGLAAELIEMLDARFPGRRWFAGTWEDRGAVRQAA